MNMWIPVMAFTFTSVNCPLSHRHAHEFIALVLQGQAFLRIDGEEIELAEGD